MEHQVYEYSKAQLISLYSDDGFWAEKNLPFSRNKLAQYISNPRAQDDDILWLISRKDGLITGYLGMIPDTVRYKRSTTKAIWISSWWVDPKYRNKELANTLIKRAFELYPQICVNSGTPKAQKRLLDLNLMKVYSGRQRCYWFCNTNDKVFQDFRLDNALYKLCSPVVHFIVTLIYPYRLSKWIKTKTTADISIEYTSVPDASCLDFIREHSTTDIAVMDKDILQWRMKNLVYEPVLKGIDAYYKTYFGNLGYTHKNYMIKLYQAGKQFGFVNLLISDGILRLPYLYLSDGYEEQFMSFIAGVVRYNGIDVIYSQHPSFYDMMEQSRFPRLFKKSYQMNVLISKALAEMEQGYLVQDGDGAF